MARETSSRATSMSCCRECLASAAILCSGAAAPQAAIAPRDEGQAVRVTRPALVFRQLEFLLGRVPALTVLTELLLLGRRFFIKREDILGVLLGPGLLAAGRRMAGDQPVPVHRDHLLHEGFGLQREEIDHATAGKRSNRDGVDHEDDLLL